jgi:branched-chain amino acid transport system substrate-binding protein
MSRHFAFLIALMTLGVTAPAVAQETWKVGALYPLTGGLAVLGNENFEGAQIAVDVINEQGGIVGRKVELVSGDASTPEKAQSEAERLLSIPGVQVITGTYSSGLSYAASQVAERRGAIYWETGGIADRLTQRGFKTFFRSVFTATSNGELAAGISQDIIAAKLGKAPKDLKVLVVHEDSDYGTSVATAAQEKAKQLGFNVIDRLPYKGTSTDLAPLVLRMKASEPDIVIASSYATDALLIQRQMKQLGVNVKAFIGTGGIYGLTSFGEGLGTAVNGIFDTEGSANIGAQSLSPEAKADGDLFRKRFQDKHGKAPSYVAMQGYIGTALFLKEVLAKAGSMDVEKLRQAALKIDIAVGHTALGWGVKFAGEGDPMMGTNLRAFPVAQQWQDGKVVVVAPTSVKTTDAVLVPLPGWDKR